MQSKGGSSALGRETAITDTGGRCLGTVEGLDALWDDNYQGCSNEETGSDG